MKLTHEARAGRRGMEWREEGASWREPVMHPDFNFIYLKYLYSTFVAQTQTSLDTESVQLRTLAAPLCWKYLLTNCSC